MNFSKISYKQLFRIEMGVWIGLVALAAICFFVLLQSDNFNCRPTTSDTYCQTLSANEEAILSVGVASYAVAIAAMPVIVAGTWFISRYRSRVQSAPKQKSHSVKKAPTKKAAASPKKRKKPAKK